MQIKQIKELADLQNFNYTTTEPFLLFLREREIFCERILRVVPKKRLVIKGLWQDKKVIVKVFFAQEAKLHLQKEINGYGALQKNEFAIPELLYAGETDIKDVYVAIFTELYPVALVSNMLAEGREEEADFWLLEMQRIITRLHNADLMQADLHLDNFLIVSDEIYLIDFSKIKKIEITNQKLSNIALFYAQLPIYKHSMILTMFADYCADCNMQTNADLEKKLIKKVHMLRYLRGQKLMRKTLRNSTKFLLEKTKRYHFVCLRKRATPELLNLLRDPEKFSNEHEVKWIKKGNTCSLFTVNIDNKLLVVKRYNVKGLMHQLRNSLQESRAVRSWQYANLLQLFAIPAAKPVAFIEQYKLGLRTYSYFIADYISNVTLTDSLLKSVDDEIIKNTKKLIRNLGVLKIAHGDMKSNNFLVDDKQVAIVDFDSMSWPAITKMWLEARRKDILRFRKNWLNQPGLMKLFDDL